MNNNTEMIFALEVSAALNNLSSLYKFDIYDMKVECINCAAIGLAKVSKFGKEKRSTLSWAKQVDTYVHMFRRCDSCRRMQEITIVENSQLRYESKTREFKQFAKFLCIGCKPKIFVPNEEFHGESNVSSEKFDFSLTNGAWSGRDEKARKIIGISQFQSRFVQLNEKKEEKKK